MKRVADAMKGGRYPSPADAKVVDDQLNKAHVNKRRQKLEVCHFTEFTLVVQPVSEERSTLVASCDGYL